MERMTNNARWAKRRLHRWLPGFLRAALHRRRLQRGQRWQGDIDTLFQSYPDREPRFLFLPSLQWRGGDGHLFQRPHHLAQALARAGGLVIFLESPSNSSSLPFEILEPGLVLSRLPLEAFWTVTSLWQYALTWNMPFLLGFESPALIYDVVDDLGAFRGDPRLLSEDHQRALSQARLVLATSRKLHTEVSRVRPDVLLCPNGVEYEHFAAASGGLPDDLRRVIARGKRVVGYYGALARWFNYELMVEVAQLRPDLEFVLIGTDHDGTLESGGLLNLPNVTFLGARPYLRLPDYLAFFDAAIIPFCLNSVTHATSPLKLFEYMAAGKPVVITPMQESLHYPGVLPAATAVEFSNRLDQAFNLGRSPQYLEQIRAVALQNSWEKRAIQILDAVRMLTL